MVVYLVASSEYVIDLPFKELRFEIDLFFSGLLKSYGFLDEELFFEELTKILEDFFKKGIIERKEKTQRIPLYDESSLYLEVEKSNGSKPFIRLSLVSPKKNSVLGSVTIYLLKEEFEKIQEEAKTKSGHSTINLLKPLGL